VGELPTGPQGLQGAPGPAGTQGPKGDTGSPGLTGYHIVTVESGTVAPGSKGQAIAMCNSGEKALGGGIGTETVNGQWAIQHAYPADSNPRFIVTAYNASATPAAFVAYAVCAAVAS
jgi:hypothetical protein